jgi:hypothetical protein
MHAGHDGKTAGTAILPATVRENEDMALPTLPTMAWKIAHRALRNRVKVWPGMTDSPRPAETRDCRRRDLVTYCGYAAEVPSDRGVRP